VVEELSQSYGEDEIAEDGVLDASQDQRSGLLVGERKEKSANRAEGDGKPIS
jgi:hypothetical protein